MILSGILCFARSAIIFVAVYQFLLAKNYFAKEVMNLASG